MCISCLINEASDSDEPDDATTEFILIADSVAMKRGKLRYCSESHIDSSFVLTLVPVVVHLWSIAHNYHQDNCKSVKPSVFEALVSLNID